jgi:hypothetical protein
MAALMKRTETSRQGSRDLSSSCFAQQSVSPVCVRNVERWVGFHTIVNILIIAAIAITLLDHCLQVERDVRIGRAQGESDDRQTRAEGHTVDLVARRRRDSAIDAYLLQGSVRGRNARCAYGEYPVTST